MAGDWIKMRSNLWDDPRIAGLCDATGVGEATVIGGLYWLWSTADQHSEDGCMPGLTLRSIDRKTGVPGFAAALVAIDWLEDDAHGVILKRFDEHNGASAKKRAVTAKRVASHRGNADVTQEALQDDQDDVTGALAREREREEKNLNQGSNGDGGTTEPLRPVDNSAPLAAAEIVKILNSWEVARDKQPKAVVLTDSKLVALAAKNVTPGELRVAYDRAVAARLKAQDGTPVNAGFIALFVDEIRIASVVTRIEPEVWGNSASGIQRKAHEIGLTIDPEESMPALKIRIQRALDRAEQPA